MKKVFLLLARWVYVMAVTFSVGYMTVHFGRRTAWYKDHLYQQLVSGDADRRLYAAGALALVGGERQLLEGLKADEPEVHSMARRGLEYLWSNAAGRKAYEMMESAAQAIEKEEFKEALQILDRLTARYPRYAEAWSQRASVLWQTEHYEEAMTDCGRALELNPNHYGAWLGLGFAICSWVMLPKPAAPCAPRLKSPRTTKPPASLLNDARSSCATGRPRPGRRDGATCCE